MKSIFILVCLLTSSINAYAGERYLELSENQNQSVMNLVYKILKEEFKYEHMDDRSEVMSDVFLHARACEGTETNGWLDKQSTDSHEFKNYDHCAYVSQVRLISNFGHYERSPKFRMRTSGWGNPVYLDVVGIVGVKFDSKNCDINSYEMRQDGRPVLPGRPPFRGLYPKLDKAMKRICETVIWN